MTFLRIDHSKLRQGHDEILNGPNGFKRFVRFVETNGREGQQTITSSQPTRIGKGEQMRSCSYAAVLGWVDREGRTHDPFASLVILASPTAALAAQVVRDKKMRNTFELFGIDPALVKEAPYMRLSPKTDKRSYESLDDHGRCKILSTTNDLILSRYEQFIELCQKRRQATGLPVLFWFDEVQRLGRGTETHGIAEVFQSEAGVLCKNTTATPCRADGEMIHGFKEAVKSIEESIERKVVGRREDDPELVDIEVINREVRSLFQQADIEVPWRYAFTNNCLCQLNMELIPVEAEVVAAGIDNGDRDVLLAAIESSKEAADSAEGDTKLLSSFWDAANEKVVSEALVRRIISAAVRDQNVIRRAVRKALEFLQARRAEAPGAKMMVFGGNDRADESDNEHLELIRRVIATEWPLFFPGTEARAMICTMKDEQTASADNVMDRLDEFENGPYDVILLKQMAAEGWDTKCAKVQINLSPIRAYTTIIQMIFRVGTPWEYKPGSTMLTGDVVTIADPFTLQYKRWLHDNQGPITRQVVRTMVGMDVGEYKQREKTRETAILVSTEEGGSREVWGDSKPVLNADEGKIALAIRRHFPDLQSQLTDAKLIDLYRRGAFSNIDLETDPEPEEDAFQDQGDRLRNAIGAANDHINSWVRRGIRRNNGVKLKKFYGEAVSHLARLVADEHNRRHPGDGVPAKFAGITNPLIAERFAETAAQKQWDEVATEIVRRLVHARGLV